MAATFVKFQCFSEHLAEKVHNLDTDTLKIALSNTAPSAANDDTLSDITQISTGGYTAGGTDAQASTSRSGGTTTVTGVSPTFTASGSSLGPFQYVILYNDTPTSPADPLIAYWDLGQTFTISDGNAIEITLAASLFTIA